MNARAVRRDARSGTERRVASEMEGMVGGVKNGGGRCCEEVMRKITVCEL